MQITTRPPGSIPNCRPPGSNRGLIGRMIDLDPSKYGADAADRFCLTIRSYINACEEDRLARTGSRRLKGF